MTKDFKLLEHTLIPAALFALNCSLIQLLYLLFMQATLSPSFPYVLICTMALLAGIIRKNKYLLVPALIAYALVLVLSICF